MANDETAPRDSENARKPADRAGSASSMANETTCIAFNHVSKRFKTTVVFEKTSVSFSRGNVHCIMGPSGSGKTTLLRLLMGLEMPDSGCVTGMENLRRAAVFQEDRLCENLSVAANLRMPHSKLKGAEKEAFLHRCNELLGAMALPDVLFRPVHELSGGMKRRVALARAVLADADVLFFDEPLKGLDSHTEQQVMRAIAPLLAGKTAFWVTHRESEMAYFESPSLTKMETL